MKKKALVIITFFCLCSEGFSQCDSTKLCYYNKDTLQYFKSVFENTKSSYINYPLEKLINALEVKPLEYSPSRIYNNIDSCNGIKLYFSLKHFYNRKTKTSIKLIIRFQNLILEDNCVEQLRRDNNFWLSSSRQFYNYRIVKDFEFVAIQY